jgi:NTE family protein
MTVLTFWRRGRHAPDGDGARHDPAPKEAVVFSGGGSLGAAQVGALQALFEAGIVPDVTVGCSVGALNAAYVAVDPTVERVSELEQVWRALSRDDVFPDGRFTVARRLAGRADHLYSNAGLRAVIESCVPLDDLAQTKIPVHIVTTDLRRGEPAWWAEGDPHEILAASACLPGLFAPVPLADSLHVDGGVVCPVPTQRALDLGAKRVWVLDVSSDFHGRADDRMNALDVLLESFSISRSLLARREPVASPGQHVVQLPSLRTGRHDIRDFSRTSALITAGREAGRAMIAAERRREIGTAARHPA